MAAGWGNLAFVHRALQFIMPWLVILVLAFVSTRRIGGLARTITQHEQARTATLDQVEQLEMRNAILQIISRSVDVPLAFQALAQRIVRLVPCDRVGLALLSDDGQEFQTYTARVNQVERRARGRGRTSSSRRIARRSAPSCDRASR